MRDGLRSSAKPDNAAVMNSMMRNSGYRGGPRAQFLMPETRPVERRLTRLERKSCALLFAMRGATIAGTSVYTGHNRRAAGRQQDPSFEAAVSRGWRTEGRR